MLLSTDLKRTVLVRNMIQGIILSHLEAPVRFLAILLCEEGRVMIFKTKAIKGL